MKFPRELLTRLDSERLGYVDHTGVPHIAGYVIGDTAFDVSGREIIGHVKDGYAYRYSHGGAPIHIGRVVYYDILI